AMLPNTPPMYEAHFGVPMIGAVLNTLNTRLDAEAIAFMLEHGEARLLITDKEFASTIEAALKLVKRKLTVVDPEDGEHTGGEPRHQRLPAQGRGGRDLQADQGTSGHALLRRADRAPDADQCTRGHEARH